MKKTTRKTISTVSREQVQPRMVQKNNLDTFLRVLGGFLLLALAGAGYALYLRLYCEMPHHTWKNHLLQWWPFVSAIGALVFVLRTTKTDTAFAEFGLIGTMSVAMPVGYVLGRLLFF